MLTLATELDALTRFGRALADPIRAQVLLMLCERPRHPADLADALGISRSRLSNHLACLRDCGLVVVVPDGRRQRYELADRRLAEAIGQVRTATLTVAVDPACPNADHGRCC